MENRPRSDERSIVLVGLMGAGKTTVGRRLARRLGLPFADADGEIEAAAGMTVGEIFEHYGEAHFRDGERRVIARLIEGPRQVIAAGGGAFVDPATRALMLERCTVIWLDAELELLAERVGRRDHRPLVRGKDPLALLRDMAEVRNPIYAQAHLAIRAGEVERTIDDIVAALG
ncbi:MAG TPA: shikimate kinase [Allosphingosinicella sp.]|nr:shikimate kinase [Allosphingosinicella sp.]